MQAHVVELYFFLCIFSVSSETSIVRLHSATPFGGSLSETRLYTILTFLFFFVSVHHPSYIYFQLRTHHTMENLMDSVQKRIFNLLESGAL